MQGTDDMVSADRVDAQELVIPSLIVILGVAMLATSGDVDSTAMLFPRIVLPVLIALGALRMGVLAYRWAAGPRRMLTQWWVDSGQRSVYVLSWIAVLPLLMWVFGVRVGSVIYVGVFGVGFTREFSMRRLAQSAIAAVMVLVVIDVGLVQLFGLRFGRGLLAGL